MVIRIKPSTLYSYFYISKIGSYPKGCYQVAYKNRYSVVELRREATEKECLVHDLLYLGRGLVTDDHIKNKLDKYELNMKLYPT